MAYTVRMPPDITLNQRLLDMVKAGSNVYGGIRLGHRIENPKSRNYPFDVRFSPPRPQCVEPETFSRGTVERRASPGVLR
jgi:hypothetical protein